MAGSQPFGLDIFELAFAASPSGMLVADADGIILMVNDQLARQFGRRVDAMVGMRLEDLFPGRFAETHPELGRRFPAVPSGRSGADLVASRRDGREFPVEVGLNPVRLEGETMVICTIQDITERRRSEEQIRAVIDAAPSGMLMVSPYGRITLVNTQLERQFGYGREVMLGRSVDMLVPERFRPAFPGAQSCFFTTPSSHVNVGGRDLFGLRADGSEFPVELGLNPVRTSEGVAVLCAVIDITERRRAEAERVTLNRRLMETSRRVGMADVATNVLHNVGNVLNSVNTSATLVSATLDGRLTADVQSVARLVADLDCSKLDSDATVQQVAQFIAQLAEEMARRESVARGELERLVQHVEHVKQVVSRQQALAKPGGMVEESQLDELIEQALSMEAPSYSALQITVERRFAPLGPIMVDRHQVLQVLTNLLVNAKHALIDTPEDARRIVVELSQDPGPAGVIRIVVRDTGHGIAAEHLDRIFEFGFTTRAAGHGFGLHSSAVAARMMGGRLMASSDGPGEGAVFVLELPSHAVATASSDAE